MAGPDDEIDHHSPVHVSHWRRDREWLCAEADRIAGNAGYRIEDRGWRGTMLYFDSHEKSGRYSALLGAHYRALAKARPRPKACKVDKAYRNAALAQYAVVWGLSSGIIIDVVRAYRRSRRECSSHGVANFAAAEAIVARCPHLDHADWDGIERARDLAEYMLIHYEARHRSWFWRGLEGKPQLSPFSFHH